MISIRCASCGWTDETNLDDASFRGATHLRRCPERDDLRFLPWWTTRPTNFSEGTVFEVGWHPVNVNDPTWKQDANGHAFQESQDSVRYRFTEYADRELIGVKT